MRPGPKSGPQQRKSRKTITLPDGTKKHVWTAAGLKRRRKTPREKEFAQEKRLVDEARAKLNGHGGKRPKAGTKPKLIENLVRNGMDAPTARKLLNALDLYELNFRFAHNKDDEISRRWVESLMDRVWGKPVQPGIMAQFSGTQSEFSHMSTAELEQEKQKLIEHLKDLGLVEEKAQDDSKPDIKALPPGPPVLDAQDVQVNSHETAPIPMPPEPVEPEYTCVKHGKYFKPKNQLSSMCPVCISDGARDSRWLASVALH